MARLDEEVEPGHLGGDHVLVTTRQLLVDDPALQLAADGGAVGQPDRQSQASSRIEREELELLAQLLVVALLGLGQHLQVGLQVLLGRPGGAVDALQLLVLLVSQPVGGRGPGQGEGVGDQLGVGQVRATAQIAPDHRVLAALHVVVDAQLRAAHLDVGPVVGTGRVGAALEPDQFQLVRLVLHGFAGLILADHPADELLVLVDDLEHHLLKGFQVLGSERLGDVEIEVEAVGDVRPDPELGVRAQLLHGLGHHVGGRVAQHIEAVRGVDGDPVHRGILRQRLVQVGQLAINADDDDVAAVAEQLGAGGPSRHRGRFAVDVKGDLRIH